MQICKIFCIFGPQNLEIIYAYKVLFKQISLKGDVNYCINHKVPIFYE